jgi:Ca2+-binding RTX toxin-like protein
VQNLWGIPTYQKQHTDLTTSGEGSNGVRFDIVDVTNTPGISATGSIKADLSQFKGYELYFKNYITTTGGFTPLEQQLITSLLPYMRDWYVQAGASGMLATDTLNRGAFMLGGKDSDALQGGTAADLLVGNGGTDILQGGKGNDTLLGGAGNDAYIYTTGDGFDTILDSDGLGSIAADGNLLTGGDQFGDARVHRDAGGHTYTDPSTGSGQVLVKAYISDRFAANDATQSAWGIAA